MRPRNLFFRKKYLCVILISTLLTGVIKGETPYRLFASGKKAFDETGYLMAIQILDNLVTIYPDYGKADEANYLSALADYYLENYVTCIGKLQRLLKNYPLSEYAHKTQYWAGACYYNLGLYENAVVHFQKQILDSDKNYYIRAHYYKGLTLQKMGSTRQAREEFLTLVTSSYENTEPEDREYIANVLYQLGTDEFTLKNYQESLTYFKKLLFAFPAYKFSSDVTFYIAECYYLLGTYAAALERYENIIAFFPASRFRGTCLFRSAEILHANGQYAASLEYCMLYENSFPEGKFSTYIVKLKAALFFRLKHYAQSIPGYIQILESVEEQEKQPLYYNLGLAGLNAKQYELAELCFHFAVNGRDEAIAKNSLLKLAGLYMELEMDALVIRCLESYRQKYPGSTAWETVLRSLAICYMRNRNPEKALEIWNVLLTEYTGSFYRDEYFFRRGLTYIYLGNYPQALVDFHMLHTLFPDSIYTPEAYYHIGYIYTLNYEYVRAFEYYDKIPNFKQEGELLVRTLLAKGINYFNIGAFPEAIALFNTLLSGHPGSKWTGILLACLGQSYLKLKKPEEAAKNFDQARLYLQSRPETLNARYWHEPAAE